MQIFLLLTLLLLTPLTAFSSDFVDQSDIKEIYTKYIEPYDTETFKNRYTKLHLSKDEKKFWKDKDFPRLIAALEFSAYTKKHPLSPNKALIINGSEDPELRLHHM